MSGNTIARTLFDGMNSITRAFTEFAGTISKWTGRPLAFIAQMTETEGAFLGNGASAEAVRDHWAEITNSAGVEAYPAGHLKRRNSSANP